MSRYRDAAGFLILPVLWGLTFPAVEVGLETFPPLLLMALRFGLGGVLLFGFVVATGDNWSPTTRGDVLAVVGGGILWTALGNGVWYIGQDLTTSVFSGMMTSLIPVTTTVVSWLLLPEDRLTPLSMVGLGVAFVGAVIIMVPGDLAFTASLVGKVILSAGVLGAALGSVLIRYADTSLSSPAQTAWSVAVGATVLYGLSLSFGETLRGDLTMAGGLAVGYLAVVSSVIAYLLYFSLLQRHPAIELTLTTYLIPVVAGVAGWGLFGESVTRSMVIGFLVIVVGFSVMKRRELREEVVRWRFGT